MFKNGCSVCRKESSNDVLDKVKSLITESGCEVPNVVIDRAHRIDKGYQDKTQIVPLKSIIVRFSTLRHRRFIGKRQTKKCERSHKKTVRDIYRCH